MEGQRVHVTGVEMSLHIVARPCSMLHVLRGAEHGLVGELEMVSSLDMRCSLWLDVDAADSGERRFYVLLLDD